MQERHKDRRRYYEEQAYTTEKYVIPFINDVKMITSDMRVLEVGCGEGGNLLPFLKMGCEVIGVDINESQLGRARSYLAADGYNQVDLILEDIYKVSIESVGIFDVIFLRDVIEHIPDQEKFMKYIKSFLKPDGIIFFGFPPWHMPFGGHQQVLKGWVSKLPYIHLLPKVLYVGLMKLANVPESTIESRMEIRETGLSLETFERHLKTSELAISKRDLYVFNPNYEIKFGLLPKKVPKIFSTIRFIRNFYTTCGYYIVSN